MRTPSTTVDDRILRCTGPGGAVTANSLNASGICRESIAGRLKAGWLERAGHGIYVVSHLRTDLTAVAVIQARHPAAAAAARTAAWMYGLDGLDRLAYLPPEVVTHPEHVIGKRPHRLPPNVVVDPVPDSHVGVRHGLRVLKALPMLESLSAAVDPDALEATIECLLRREEVTEDAIWAWIDAHSLRRELALYAVMQRRGLGTPATDSYLETLTIQRVLRPAGLVHRRQVPVWINRSFVGRFDFELESGLLVEAHGMATHATPAGLQRDLWRATSLRLGGREVESITWDDVLRRPRTTGRRLRARSEQLLLSRAEHQFDTIGV